MQAKPDPKLPERMEVRAAGGVLFRRWKDELQHSELQHSENIEVLLILRRGLWDLPKGIIERDELSEQGACREVEEETGCQTLRIITSLGTTTHEYEQDGLLIRKETRWYAMQSGKPELTPQQEEEIEALEWMELSRAFEKVAFDNLREVLHRFSLTMVEK